MRPLAFARDAARGLYRADVTLVRYRGVRLEHPVRAYRAKAGSAQLAPLLPAGPPPDP